MTCEEERLETQRLAKMIATILDDRSDQVAVDDHHSLSKAHWARSGMLAAFALIGTGGSLALATILQRAESDHRTARPVRVAIASPATPQQGPPKQQAAITPKVEIASVVVKRQRLTDYAPPVGKKRAVHVESRLAIARTVASPADENAPSPHLTGEALRLALIEDSARTRALNLKELAMVDRIDCRKRAQERC